MNIPDKLTFKRMEVIKLTKLDGRVLDYWQKEFGVFVPMVNKSGDLFYTRKDVELILKIKQWMITEKINKLKIKELLKADREMQGVLGGSTNTTTFFGEEEKNIPADKLKIIKNELQEILTILEKNDKR
jgi:DNA-binding transcriptional MerR regulator